MIKNVALRIQGRVQGVGFRYHTQQKALENKLKGIVKNMVDGTVYIEASGEEERIDNFVRWCHEGPKWAYVESVDIQEIKHKEYGGFTIKHT